MCTQILFPVVAMLILCSACGNPDSKGEAEQTSGSVNAVAERALDDTGKDPGHFTIAEEDRQYIDLMIPEYAEIVFYYEDAPETMHFAEHLINYFRSKQASVEIHKQGEIADKRDTGSRKFRIDFIGDHRYVVRLYN